MDEQPIYGRGVPPVTRWGGGVEGGGVYRTEVNAWDHYYAGLNVENLIVCY